MSRPTTTASNLFRRSLCPGSARLESGLPDEDSPQAKEGRLLHDYAAHPEYDRSVLSPEQCDLLASAELLQAEVIRRVELEIPKGLEICDSKEVTIHAPIGEIRFTGTPDFRREYRSIGPDYVLIIDTKFGYKVVERADLNMQLRAYARLACWSHVTLCVFVAIIQPRLGKEERITIAKYTQDDISEARKQINLILEVCDNPKAPLIAGDDQCRYCKAKLICEAYQSKMMVTLPLTPDKALSKAAKIAYLEQRLAEQSDEKLSQILQAISFGKMLNDPANDEARRRGDTEYWTIGNETEVREVTDVRKAIALLSLSGLSKEEIFQSVSKLSITTLTETIRKKHPNWNAKTARDWVDKTLRSTIETVTRKSRVIRNAKIGTNSDTSVQQILDA